MGPFLYILFLFFFLNGLIYLAGATSLQQIPFS